MVYATVIDKLKMSVDIHKLNLMKSMRYFMKGLNAYEV